jgi:chromosome partitioning protein
VNAPVIAFFNNRGGVGTTTLVYHLAWMFSDLGIRVLAADLDPQADLTTLCLGVDQIETLWHSVPVPTICAWLEKTSVDLWPQHPWPLNDNLHLVPGDLRLAWWERDGIEATSSFARILPDVARDCRADVVLLDLGPNLGAINQAALYAADSLVVPLTAEWLSIQGMINVGETLPKWRQDWARSVDIRPLGYVLQQGAVRLNRPLFEQWIALIPGKFHRNVIGCGLPDPATSIMDDPLCLALIKYYHSLMPLAQQIQKPMFHLTEADGAIGSYLQGAQSVGQEYKRLGERIAKAVGLKLPYLSGSVA